MANVGTAAAGKTLIGTGQGASPTFASIGTNSGLTANSVVIAEGNDPFTTVSPGKAGNVLTSDGTFWISSSDPTKIITDFDDFLGAQAGASQYSAPKLGWVGPGGMGYSPSTGTLNNPGIWASPSGDAAISLLNGNFGANFGCFLLGGGQITINWVINLGTLSTNTNRYTYYCGMSDFDGTAAPALASNGCWFQYSDNVNSGNWQIVCGKSGAYTTVNTLVAANTNFVNLEISVDAVASSVSFKINGSPVGSTISTHIPNVVAISPSIVTVGSVGTAPINYIDLFYYTQILTNSR